MKWAHVEFNFLNINLSNTKDSILLICILSTVHDIPAQITQVFE